MEGKTNFCHFLSIHYPLIVITFDAIQSALLSYLSELQLLTVRELKFSTGPIEGPSHPPHLQHGMVASEFYDPFS